MHHDGRSVAVVGGELTPTGTPSTRRCRVWRPKLTRSRVADRSLPCARSVVHHACGRRSCNMGKREVALGTHSPYRRLCPTRLSDSEVAPPEASVSNGGQDDALTHCFGWRGAGVVVLLILLLHHAQYRKQLQATTGAT